MEYSQLAVHVGAVIAAGIIVFFAIMRRKQRLIEICPRCKEERNFFVRSIRENARICLGCADIENDRIDDLVI